MSIKTFKRYENKYLMTKYQYEQLAKEINKYMNPDGFCKDGAKYTIFNIYYDTDDNRLIEQSLSKPYYKEKLRLRSYEIPKSENEEVFMEIKKKIGGIVTKRRATMTLKEANDFVLRGIKPETDSYINRQVVEEIAFFLKKYKVTPKVFISYERNAYFGKEDKDFRLTFDSNIKTRREELDLKKGTFGQNLMEEKTYLMEVKISGAIPLWLAHKMSELEIRKTRFSKYGNEYKRFIKEGEPQCSTQYYPHQHWQTA